MTFWNVDVTGLLICPHPRTYTWELENVISTCAQDRFARERRRNDVLEPLTYCGANHSTTPFASSQPQTCA